MNPFRGHVSRHSRILHKKLKTTYVRVTQIVIEELIREIEKKNVKKIVGQGMNHQKGIKRRF
jgi:hypothetical protein